MNFKINDFTTITDFKLLQVYDTFMKFGKPYAYRQFTGFIRHKAVRGWICLVDNNIYELKYIEDET